jgi:Uma2 family endonuclease
MAGGVARIPDVAFVSQRKLDSLPDEDIAMPFAPDLAIEITSNSEIAARVERRFRSIRFPACGKGFRLRCRLSLPAETT